MHSTLLSTREAADALGVSRYALYRLIKSGALRPVKMPGTTGAYVFEPAAVEQLAAERAS